MGKGLLTLLCIGVFIQGGSAFGDICSTKPESETVKSPLPVKYQKLKEENGKLRSDIEECRERAEELKGEVSALEAQLSELEAEKARLAARLNLLPNKESLEAQIKELENREGGRQ